MRALSPAASSQSQSCLLALYSMPSGDFSAAWLASRLATAAARRAVFLARV